jgi:hypothetical protein
MPSLTLALLGSPSITRADGSAVSFRLRKELALLAYLAVEGPAAQPRERLLGLLWPEATDESARNNLRVALANLRQALGDAAPSADRQLVQLALESGALDVATFQELLTTSHTAISRICPAPRAPRASPRRLGCIVANFWPALRYPMRPHSRSGYSFGARRCTSKRLRL